MVRHSAFADSRKRLQITGRCERYHPHPGPGHGYLTAMPLKPPDIGGLVLKSGTDIEKLLMIFQVINNPRWIAIAGEYRIMNGDNFSILGDDG